MEMINAVPSLLLSRIPVLKVLGLIGIAEVVSYAAHNFEAIQLISTLFLIIVTLIVSLVRLEYGIAIAFVELVIGSKGYLFSLAIGDSVISIRVLLFVAIAIATVVWMIRERRIAYFHWKYWKQSTAVMGIILLGIIVGYLEQHSLTNIFFDANGYVFFGLVVPLVQAIRSKEQLERLLAVILVAFIGSIIKTVALVSLFPKISVLPYTLPGLYKWIRDTGVGEITLLPNGFYRIFFQSHIYALIIFFLTLPSLVLQRSAPIRTWLSGQWKDILLFVASFLVLLISSSRSFWVAAVGTMCIGGAALLFSKKITIKQTVFTLALIGATFTLSYGILFGLVNIPVPGSNRPAITSLVGERTSDLTTEAAAASRWSLIKPLTAAALEKPLLGSGLGATVTYQSSDYRVLETSPNGQYTTYAFEWGYLDLLYKFGVLGVLVFIWFGASLYRDGLLTINNSANSNTTIGILLSITALLLTHIFTPYLNHPLGISWIIITAILLTLQSNRHEQR